MVLQGYTGGVSVVARGLTSGTIDGNNNEHSDAIRHFSSSARTGWMEGCENRQKEHALREMLTKNLTTKLLSDVCKAACIAHLYKFAGTHGGGCGVPVTRKKLRQNQILKWVPFPPEPFDAYMAALEAMPEVLEEYRDPLQSVCFIVFRGLQIVCFQRASKASSCL